MSRLQVGRYTHTHVLKIKRHLVQPCVNFDAIYGPFKGLWWVDFNALVSNCGMTIGSMVNVTWLLWHGYYGKFTPEHGYYGKFTPE